MAICIGTSSGGSFHASSLSAHERSYDPVYDTEVPVDFLWNLLPSFYREVMEDKEVFEALWEGVTRAVTASMLHLWHAGAASNLRDVPVLSQRKWQRYDLFVSVDLSEDPGLVRDGLRIASWEDEQLSCIWQNRAGSDMAGISLGAAVTEAASLSWRATLAITSSDRNSCALIGYYATGESTRKDVLAVGVVGQASSSLVVPCIVHYSSTGMLTFVKGSVALVASSPHEFSASYRARDGAVSLEVIDTNYEKASGTCVCADDVDSDGYTAELSDSSATFVTDGVAIGDTLEAYGTSYEIVTVTETEISVAPGTLPAGASVFYTITGAQPVATLALNLVDDAADGTFVVDTFGVLNLDLRNIYMGTGPSASAFVQPSSVRRRLQAATYDWTYLDPSIPYSLIKAPRLQDAINASTFYLYEGIDYRIENSVILFQEPPTTVLWAEYAAYDEQFIQNNFGINVELTGESSELFRSQVRGLYYAYFQGPTLSAIQTGVQIMLGLPISDAAGSVESVNPSYSGDYGEMVIGGRSYLYPLTVGTPLIVGDTVEAYQALSDGVEVVDYITDPEWFVLISGFREVEKYHTFALRLDLDAFGSTSLAQAASFLDAIKPTWKDALFIVHKDVEDDWDIGDDLTFKRIYSFVDTFCDGPLVAYDDKEYEGDQTDWRYDQGLVPWESTSPAMRWAARRYTEIEFGSPYLDGVVTLADGSADVAGEGTSFLAQLGGPGLVTDKYLAAARYFSGTTGAVEAGSHILEDLSADFSDVQVGDAVSITGEEDCLVQEVVDSTHLNLDKPAAATSTAVAWSVTGRRLTWGLVSSVADDEALTCTTPFSGTSGSYKVSLIDPNWVRAYYDYYDELFPEEDLTLVARLSPGFNETELTGLLRFTEGSTDVSGDVTDFLAEIGVGAVTDKYLVTPAGEWVLINTVEDPESITLVNAPTSTHTNVPGFLATTVLSGTLDFVEGSATVATSADLTLELSAGDWVQAVPGTGPVVQIDTLDAVSITLLEDYPGSDQIASKAILRGPDGCLPTISLPGGPQAFTGWYGASGGELDDTVPERLP